MSFGTIGSPSRSFRSPKRRWGFSSPNATIGFERQLLLKSEPDRLLVGDGPPIPVGRGETREELLQRVVTAIEREARAWGKPPSSFYWIPSVRFIVIPGGNQHYERLNDGLRTLGLQTSVDYRLDATRLRKGDNVKR